MDQNNDASLELVAEIVAAYVGNNALAAADLGGLISSVHAAISGLGAAPAEPAPEAPKPAVPVRRSIHPDHIVCLEDGKQMKMLKRHLSTDHDLTPAAYRAKWKLPDDYPMVAPNYAATRSALAKTIGLGRRAAPVPVAPPPEVKPPAKRTRRSPQKASPPAK